MPRVLIVDDDATVLALCCDLLKKIDGVESICFDNPEEALEWCQSRDPDLVLLDYMMPTMNGLTFIEHFRSIESCKDIPLIMVTGDTEKKVRIRALELGAHDFLTKPFDTVEFLARTRNLLALRKHQIDLADRAVWLAIEIQKATVELLAREKEMVLRLSRAAEHRDPETGQHLLRMANYSKLIARELNLPEVEQNLILEAAPMHDIGKVATPDAILLKQGKLTTEEFVIMKDHAAIGYNILRDSDSLLIRTAATMAWTHHEKFDGSGYPNNLEGEEIPIFGRIVAVADVFDALTSVRPYKKAWALDDAVNFLKEHSGSHFDPKCVDALLNVWDEILEIHAKYQEPAHNATA